MNRRGKTFLAFLALLCSFQSHGITGKTDSLSYEIFLNSKLLNDLKIRTDFVPTVDISANQLIMLASSDQFYLLGWGGMVPFGKPSKGEISSFAFAHDSSLLVIRNDELCYFDPDSKLSMLYRLPDKGMGISAGEKLMFIYDRNKKKDKKAVYAVAQGGKYTKVLELPNAINEVVENGNSLILASGNSLFDYNIQQKKLKAITVMPAGKEIRSVAFDRSEGRIYFSADNKIYALKDTSAAIISDDFGGILKYSGKGLIVFSPEKKIVARIVGIEKEIKSMPGINETAEKKKPEGILTNSSIADMAGASLSDQMIIELIRRSKVNFDLSVDSIVGLSQKGVSSGIIMEMKQAMKRQQNPTKNN